MAMGKEQRNASALTHPMEGVSFSCLHPFSARGLQLSLNMMVLVFVGSGMLWCKDRNEPWEERAARGKRFCRGVARGSVDQHPKASSCNTQLASKWHRNLLLLPIFFFF